MSSRLRSLDSKISFFAFADIITAVSGVLIFVALLLATDLGKPTESRSTEDQTEMERQIHETLAQQAKVDAQNHRLSTLLTTAATAPGPGELQTDITRLQKDLATEQKKAAAIAGQMDENQAALNARDKALGLTGLKATIQSTIKETAAVAELVAQARAETEKLELKIAHAESALFKLRQRDGQLWLIPEKSGTSKEPILVTVSGTGITIDRFEHPDQRQQLDGANVKKGFEAYLKNSKVKQQYVVFLMRPSGIGTFHELLKTARDQGFDVGYDALEEDRQIHFSTPPPPDDSLPTPLEKPPGRPVNQPIPGTPRAGAVSGGYSGNNPNGNAGGNSGPNFGGNAGGDNGGNAGGNLGGNERGSSGGNSGGNDGTGAGKNSGTNSGTATGNTTGKGTTAGTGASPGTGTNINTSTNATGQAGATNAQAKAASAKSGPANGVPPPPEKSWWQRLLEWIGVK